MRNRWLSMPLTSRTKVSPRILADGGGLDVGAFGRKPFAAALVPIIEQLAIGRVFHFAPPVAPFALGAVPSRDRQPAFA